MACRRIIQVPKVTLRHWYFQPTSVNVSACFATRLHPFAGFSACRCASSGVAAPATPDIPEERENIYYRFRRKMGFPVYSSGYYRAMAVLLYEKIDHVSTTDFFQEFELEDTFYSWFLMMELHLWMLLSRASQHGKEGKIVKEYLGKVMWEDVRRRIKLVVTDLPVAEQTKTMTRLSEETDYALLLYDEALQSDDRRLAEALWVRLYRGGTVEPVVLEKLVCYVRKQIRHLDLVPREQIILRAQLKWLTIKDCRI